jgi:hypothetical protein
MLLIGTVFGVTHIAWGAAVRSSLFAQLEHAVRSLRVAKYVERLVCPYRAPGSGDLLDNPDNTEEDADGPERLRRH